MVLTEILEINAKKYPDKTALVMQMGYRTVSLSYQDVYEWSKKIAVFLERQGLQKGDKVLILAPNSPYWICVWWGSLLGGYAPVPLNIQSTSEMIRKIAEQTEARIIFKFLHFKQDLPQNLKVCEIDFLPEYLSNTDISKFRKTELLEEDIVELMYTSGTTGDPKGVILTHKNLYSNLDSFVKVMSISPDDRFLSILPLSHIYEQMAGFLLPFYSGCQIIYAHSPAAIRDLLKENQIAIMAAVPEFLRIMMDKIETKAEEEGKKKLLEKMLNFSLKIGNKTIQKLIFHSIHKKFGGKLRIIASAGAPLDPLLEKKWSALGFDLFQGYGLTETSPVISCNSHKENRLGSVGKILPGVEVKIAADGEILVKGPNIFQGYFKNEEKTKESFTADGWFQTGDMGEMDKDNFLFIKGRKKYMIKGPGAQNVYPEDIEFELSRIPGVKDSCVVGLEKSGGQVEVHAVLLGEDIKDPEKIIEQANAKLTSYQQITNWSAWPKEDFPRSATRKVKKEEVLKWLGAKEKSVEEPPSQVEKKTPLERLLAQVTNTDVALIRKNTKIVSELRLDSLLRVELVARIEEQFGAAVEESKITGDTKVSDLEEIIKKQGIPARRPAFKRWPLASAASFLRTALQTFFIFPFFRIFVKLRVEGLEHLKGLSLPVVFMPNHLSYMDSVMVIMALPFKMRKKIAFAAAVDVLYKTYRHFARPMELLFNTFPFPRREYENIKFGLEYFGKLLDKGWSVVVYPEGKISLTGELQPFKRGAGLIATEMDVPIVLVRIVGAQQILPSGKFIPKKRGEVVVKFGRPIKFQRSDSYIEVTEKLTKTMGEL